MRRYFDRNKISGKIRERGKLMVNFLLKVYIRSRVLLWSITNFFRLLTFVKYLHKNKLFGTRDPKFVLKVVQKYIEIESYTYSDKFILSRSKEQSIGLLSVLIDKYMETESDNILEQIIEVLKTDFIKRERNGRE